MSISSLQQALQQIRAYSPWNEQEEKDQAMILHLMETTPNIFDRSSLSAHMTASAWVTTPDLSHFLMAYHKIYHSWAWLGGHADGEYDLQAVALREAKEESGVENIQLPTDKGGILSLEVLPVAGHEKHGVYVPSHLHLNVTYLFVASEEDIPRIKPDENSAVGWLTAEEMTHMVSEPWMMERIYQKLLAKLAETGGKL